jgi:hypothetical protein
MAGQGLQSLPLKLLVTMMTSAPNLLALSLLATPTRIQKLLPRTPSLGVKKKPQKRTFKNKRKSKKGDKKRGDFGSPTCGPGPMCQWLKSGSSHTAKGNKKGSSVVSLERIEWPSGCA